MKIQTALPLIRNYLPGDDGALVTLWNLAYASYAGYVPRSLDYWRWSVFGRPGITPQDMIILQNERDILGYGVLGPNGNVLEFAVDPRLSGRKRLKVATRLIKAIEERSRIRGDEEIQFEVPITDEPIRRALRRSDFYDEEADESLNIAIVNLAGLLTKILCHREGRIPKGWSPTFLFEIEPGHYRFCPYEHLNIQIGPPLVLKTDSGVTTADYTVVVDLSTLTDLIFSRTTFEKAMTAGYIAIRPILGLRDVRLLMGLIAIESSWYTRNADYK